MQPSCSPSSGLILLQYVHISLALGNPRLDAILQRWSHKCRIEGKDHFSHDIRYIFPGTLGKFLYLSVCQFLVCEIGLSLSHKSFVHINSDVLR